MSPSLPTAYLEAYPLPAFVVSVTAIGQGPGQSQSQAQRYASSHRQSKRGSEGSISAESASGEESIGAPFARLALHDEGGASTPVPGHPEGRPALEEHDTDKTIHAPTASDTSPSSSISSERRRFGFWARRSSWSKSVTTTRHDPTERLDSEAQDAALVAEETEDDVAPLLDFHKPPRVQIVWANEQWNRLACGMAIHDLVQPTTLAAFTAWVEAQSEDLSDAVAHATASFGLELQTPAGVGMTMDVIKTRHSGGSGLLIVTATRLQTTKPRASPPVDLPKTIQRNMAARTAPEIVNLVPPASDEAVPLCSTLLEETDWSKTSLGPRENWSPEIKLMVHLVFSSLDEDSVWIGPDSIVIYNQAYASLVDHPRAFGKPAKEVWSSIWDEVGRDMERALTGQQVYRPKGLIVFKEQSNGNPVETYHSYSLMPIFDAERNVIALWNPSTDHTDKTIAERRLDTTRLLVEEVAWARSRPEYFDAAARVLATNPIDAPFAAFYSAKKKALGTEHSSPIELVRAATIGVPEGHPHIPARLLLTPAVAKAASSISAASTETAVVNSSGKSHTSSTYAASHRSSSLSDLGSSHPSSTPSRSSWGSKKSSLHMGAESLLLPFARALESRQCVVLENSRQLFSGLTVRQWDSLPDTAIVVPLNLESTSAAPPALLLLGLNLYRPLDTEYEDWIQQVRGHLASGLSSVLAFEEEIEHHAEKEKLERAKEAWFRGAAHEFRTPLSLIAGPLDDILHSNKLDSVRRKQLTIAYRNTRRLQQLMTSLFDFTRLESGRVTARFMPVDLREFVTDIGTIFKVPIDKLRRIKLRIKAEEHAEVCVDPVLLEIVVSHLIVNALKHTDHGIITLTLSFTSDAAVISVSDTGLGIPEADIDTVTDVFHRSETANNRGSEGTGMGLALVKEIVRLHEGTLTIKSQTLSGDNLIPRGSTFIATLPLTHEANVEDPVTSFGVYSRQVAEEVAQWSVERGHISSDSDASGTSKSMPAKSENASVSSGFRDGLDFEKSDILLIVDTEKDMLDFMRTLFEPFCTVVTAQTSTEAIAIAKATPPNLILSELSIRPLNGLELLAEIRMDQELKHMPMLSYSTDDDQRMAALIAGADDFISKPFKPQELLLRVHLHMQMGKRRSMLETLFMEREQELVVLTDACPSGILRTDANGRLMYANDSFREPAGIAPGEHLSTWLDYCDEDTRTRLAAVWLEILTGDEVKTNIQWKWKTGKTMSGVFIRLDKIRPGMSGIIACVTDISYQEEKLIDAHRRRIEAEESKHQQELLVDLTSHEIRTPVSAILQCSSLVKENLVALKEQLRFAGNAGFQATPKLLADLEDDVEALESIYQCGLVQERIAGDVLSLARIQLDMLTIHAVEMNIEHEAKKILSVFSIEAKMKKIDIELELGESLQALGVSSIKTDPVRLGQVVTNLTANAIRFTSTSPKRKITVRYDVGWVDPEEEINGGVLGVEAAPDRPSSAPAILSDDPPPKPPTEVTLPLPEDTPVYLFVSVTDTGPGMTPQEKNVLFQRFHQGNRMIHTQYGGSGLGLFICKKITELLGGQIEVQSQVGVGSTFRFHIKARTIAPPVPKSAIVPIVVPLSSPPLATKPVMESFRVLIVEDNAINQMALKRQLTKAGLKCDTADNGQEALYQIHEANRQSRHTEGTLAGYDVILMDLEMPVMDGLTAVRHIREAEATGALRPQLVIALTGNARQAQVDHAIQCGMDDVVIKPYRLAALLTKMWDAVLARRVAHSGDWYFGNGVERRGSK